ncbi:hypothetical protein [Brevibacillus fortis]|uniref:hypothetical protein n=1 Tax=Brevibacillus fortis TaxID=2126352 RepID=UPI0038FCBE7B
MSQVEMVTGISLERSDLQAQRIKNQKAKAKPIIIFKRLFIPLHGLLGEMISRMKKEKHHTDS